MSKYHELVKQFSSEIESIKVLQSKEAEINVRLTEAYKAEIDDADHFFACEAIEDERSQVHEALHAEQEALNHHIEMEYWDVPFATPRKQGIAGFFSLAGL